MKTTDELLKKKNVIGVSEGKDAWNDSNTVTVFVSKKLTKDTLAKYIRDPTTDWTDSDVIPKFVKNFFGRKRKTDVIELGEVKIHADRAKYRPMKGGCEIGIIHNNFVGTAGALVKFKTYKWGIRTFYLLDLLYGFVRLLELKGESLFTEKGFITNAHVSELSVLNQQERSIVQPGLGLNIIGSNVYTAPIHPTKYNEFDVSIIRLEDGIASSEEVIEVGDILGVRDGVIDEEVHKYGRTTRYTEGKLLARNASIAIDYGVDGVIKFKGLDVYSRMSAGGDSGSVIVAKTDNQAVSLLFAGSLSCTLGIPMKKIVNKLGVVL